MNVPTQFLSNFYFCVPMIIGDQMARTYSGMIISCPFGMSKLNAFVGGIGHTLLVKLQLLLGSKV